MLRCLIIAGAFALPIALTGPGLTQTPAPEVVPQQSSEQAMIDDLWQVLRLGELMPILRDEALVQGNEMAETMFGRAGMDSWNQTIARIHDPARLEGMLRRALSTAMVARDPVDIASATAFYETPLGRRVVQLETSARKALLVEGVEDDAKAAFARGTISKAPRIAQIRRLLDDADLVEPNVAGALNAALAFSQGFLEGDGYQMPMSAEQLLSDVMAQEPTIRQDTVAWLEAYLLFAYSPISDQELDEYTVFASSAEGKALANLLFSAFDAVFSETARDMGLSAAGQMEGRSL